MAELKIGKFIELAKSPASAVKSQAGKKGVSSLPGLQLFIPGERLPIICTNENACAAYGVVVSCTLTKEATTLEYEIVSASNEDLEAGYRTWQIVTGNSAIGDFVKKDREGKRYQGF